MRLLSLSFCVFFMSIQTFAQISYEVCNQVLYPIKNYKLNKYGYIDRNGILKIDFQFDYGFDFKDGFAEVDKNEKRTYINSDGVTISDVFPGSLNSGRRVAALNEKFGFINSIGKLVIPYKYSYAEPFDNKSNLAAVGISGKYGYIDSLGIEVIPIKFDSAGTFTNGIAIVSENKMFYHINKKGKPLYTERFDKVGNFYDSVAYFKLNNKYGFINTKGIKITNPIYDDCNDFESGIASVKIREKWFLINKLAKIIVKDSFDNAREFFHGLAPVQKNAKWGCVNTIGNLVIPCIYDKPIWFYDPVAYAFLQGSKITINKRGEQVSGDDYGIKGDGLIPVFKIDSYGEKKWGFVDSLGNIKIDYLYSKTFWFKSGLCPVSLTGSNYFFINTKNQKINNTLYQFANPFHEGFASVQKSDNERTYLDTLGNEVPYIFEDEFSFREGILSYVVYRGKNLVIDISNGKTYFTLPDGYQVDKIFCKDFIRWRYNIGGENARVNMATGEILNPGIDYDGYMTSDKKVFFYPEKK